jgi:hypothetical protein
MRTPHTLTHSHTLPHITWQVMRTNAPAAIAVAVVHNKLKPKDAELPPGVVYMAGEDVPPKWYQHTHLALALAIFRSLARSLSFTVTRSLSRARALSLALHTHTTHTPPFVRAPALSIHLYKQ